MVSLSAPCPAIPFLIHCPELDESADSITGADISKYATQATKLISMAQKFGDDAMVALVEQYSDRLQQIKAVAEKKHHVVTDSE